MADSGIIQYAVYEDGTEKERDTIDMSLINFGGATPESAYNGRTHIKGQTTVTDFKYDIPVFYGDMALKDKSGNAQEAFEPADISARGDRPGQDEHCQAESQGKKGNGRRHIGQGAKKCIDLFQHHSSSRVQE